MPDKPGQELAVALAGPAVNVGIAALLFAFLYLTNRLQPLASVDLIRGNLLERLMLVNITLVVFNLLPAFPMDGGRVLRALLAYRLEYARATRIAAVVGQGMAAIFGILGLMGNPVLVFIALFVWIGASQEAQAAELRSVLQGRTVRDAMMTRFRALDGNDGLGVAKDELLAGAQQDFPVVTGGRVVGMLSRTELIRGLAEHGLAGRVGDSMVRDCPVAEENEPLEAVYLRMRQRGCTTLPVVRGGGELTGIVTLENVGELMMVDFATRGRR
jgi:CBS domain-containing protein